MIRRLALVAMALLVLGAPVSAASVTGQYVESRTCDVYTGPCFANAEMNLTGKNAMLAWKVEQGVIDNVRLDGLGVVAVVQASDTLGLKQDGPAKAVLIVDAKANAAQKAALQKLAQQQGGEFLRNIVAVETAPIDIVRCECKSDACTIVKAGTARIETRCIDVHHDKACGNESAYYPPLAKGVKAQAAMASEHSFQGKGLSSTWKENDRRGAYVGSFEIR
jgi:hypothetical protein